MIKMFNNKGLTKRAGMVVRLEGEREKLLEIVELDEDVTPLETKRMRTGRC